MRVSSTRETAVLSKAESDKKTARPNSTEMSCSTEMSNAWIRPQGQKVWFLHIELETTHPPPPTNETSQRMHRYARAYKNEKVPDQKKNTHTCRRYGSSSSKIAPTTPIAPSCCHRTCVASIFLRTAKSSSRLDQSHTNTSECTRLANASGKSGLSDRAFR